ncbi:uncharacterized protein LOC144142142 [Haemaphysalis longicornis]
MKVKNAETLFHVAAIFAFVVTSGNNMQLDTDTDRKGAIHGRGEAAIWNTGRTPGYIDVVPDYPGAMTWGSGAHLGYPEVAPEYTRGIPSHGASSGVLRSMRPHGEASQMEALMHGESAAGAFYRSAYPAMRFAAARVRRCPRHRCSPYVAWSCPYGCSCYGRRCKPWPRRG